MTDFLREARQETGWSLSPHWAEATPVMFPSEVDLGLPHARGAAFHFFICPAMLSPKPVNSTAVAGRARAVVAPTAFRQ